MFGVLLDVLSHGDVLVHSDVLAHGDVLALGVHLGAAALVEVGVPRSTSESLGVRRSIVPRNEIFPENRVSLHCTTTALDTLLSQIRIT